MSQMTNENEKFLLGIDIDAEGKVTKTLKTSGKFVDRDIDVEVNVPGADPVIKTDVTVSAAVSTTDTTYLTDTNTGFGITMEADASTTQATVGVDKAGFVAATETVNLAAKTAETASQTKYIKAGALKDLTHTLGKNEASTVLLQDATQGDKFTIQVDATGKGGVMTAGWITTDAEKEFSDSVIYSIPEVTFANQVASETIAAEYENIDTKAPVLISGGYLFINEGYIAKSKISLKHLVPDEAVVKPADAKFMLTGISAYDKDGNMITGTMKTLSNANIALTATGASVNITTLTPAFDAGGSNFKVTGSGDITGTASAVVNAPEGEEGGYIPTGTTKSGSISGTGSVNATLAQAALAADVVSQGAVKPVIKDAGSNAKVEAISATAPEDMKYVKVDTTAIAKSYDVNPKVATAGYATTDHFTATKATVTAGAEAADVAYIGIQNGSVIPTHSHELTQEVITLAVDIDTEGVFKATKEEGKTYITIGTGYVSQAGSTTAQATETRTEGYVEAGNTKSALTTKTVKATINDAADKYIEVYAGDFE